MARNEQKWDKKLNINTTGRDDSHADDYRYPYEPTSYAVLERLAKSGYLERKNVIVDYGCGRGRVGLFLGYLLKCRTIGLEYDISILKTAQENLKSCICPGNTVFIHKKAEEYDLDSDADRFYFFNPFSVEILKKVMARILTSYYENPREMLLFFYYPSDEYVSYLMTVEALQFTDEIDCRDLFDDNPRERILIFEILG